MNGDADRKTAIAPEDRVLLGRIAGAQGLRGEVKINSFTAIPEDIGAYGALSDAKGRGFAIERVRPLKGGAVVAQLAGIRDRNAAEALRGTELYVARERLPETDDEEWYIEDLIGLMAASPDGETVGEVVAVQNFGAGDLLEIRPEAGRQTLFVPFTKAAVPLVDIKAARLVVDLPQDEDEDDDER